MPLKKRTEDYILDLNLFENLKKDIKSNDTIKNFMEELTDFLKNVSSSQPKDELASIDNEKETSKNEETTLDKNLKENRKEGHLYLVTEDRLGEVYLWDFTDKPKHEFKEVISSEELLSVAKEGTMLQYKNGEYTLYSTDGYDMLFNEEN